jgi:hypothetical protein
MDIPNVVRNALWAQASDPREADIIANGRLAILPPLRVATLALNAAVSQPDNSAGRHLAVALMKVAQTSLRLFGRI